MKNYKDNLNTMRKTIHKAALIHMFVSIPQVILYGVGIFLIHLYIPINSPWNKVLMAIFSIACGSFTFCLISWIAFRWYSPLYLLKKYKLNVLENKITFELLIRKLELPASTPHNTKQWLKASEIKLWTFIPIINVIFEVIIVKLRVDTSIAKIENYLNI